LSFTILFENNDVIAVDKPENVASIPTRVLGEESIHTILSSRCATRLFIVHRLDKGVSGVMLFAKTAEFHKNLNKQFFQRSITKTYLLLAHGEMGNDSYVVNRPIRQFGSGRMGVDEKNGKESITEFSVLHRGEGFSLVKAFPKTGRRHQIRVHAYSLGHPIAGDLRYGNKELQKTFPRLMLHAAAITFNLASGETKTLKSPLPGSFTDVIKNVKTSAPWPLEDFYDFGKPEPEKL
jgi:tRNA pseudouridine32 synthase / 23S rRNA pseudouridine746 synthase